MTESKHTEKFHPSPARDQKKEKDGQSNGASQSLAGRGNHPPSPNVIEENRKTEKGYEDLRKKKKRVSD